ncbi:MAG: hypothetical protein LBO20_07275 [Bifidobacteriaceae bacterium]|jgi:hypothetical protein|nr:hypothetical protein [Bifidobacteriaceae bacterium]
MDWTEAVLIGLAVAVAVVMAVWVAASRLDRLHRRVDAAWASLQLQLARRASMALDLAHSGVWDPPTSQTVASVARAALGAAPSGQEHSDLSAALRAALDGADGIVQRPGDGPQAERVAALGAAWYRAVLARRFLNDAVALTRRLRSRRLVRLFHLAGGAPMPLACDIDDAPPEALPLR